MVLGCSEYLLFKVSLIIIMATNVDPCKQKLTKLIEIRTDHNPHTLSFRPVELNIFVSRDVRYGYCGSKKLLAEFWNSQFAYYNYWIKGTLSQLIYRSFMITTGSLACFKRQNNAWKSQNSTRIASLFSWPAVTNQIWWTVIQLQPCNPVFTLSPNCCFCFTL